MQHPAAVQDNWCASRDQINVLGFPPAVTHHIMGLPFLLMQPLL